MPFYVSINLVTNTFNLSPNLLQLIHDSRVIIVILASKLVDQRNDDRERSRHDCNNDRCFHET